jgi:hypothetical protein
MSKAAQGEQATLGAEAEPTPTLRLGLPGEGLTMGEGEEWTEVPLSEVSSPLAGPALKASVFASTPVGPRLLRGINLGRSGTRWKDADTVFWNQGTSVSPWTGRSPVIVSSDAL